MTVYHFGPFDVDDTSRRLLREGQPIALGERQIEVLLQLIAQPGVIVSRQQLIDRAWGEIAVTDNSLEQAVSTLRRVLGGTTDGTGYIETVARQGYRFAAAVSRTTTRTSDGELDALLEPHRAWLDGRAALETLGREEVAIAHRAFERALAVAPDYAPAHLGLANACAFRFEATRADEHPDDAALSAAVEHAREACRLEPHAPEAWATLGFVLNRLDPSTALAALRRATALEPDNWRHHVRLAYVGWGAQRLSAAHRALALVPGLALAHWLAATVHVARQSFAVAERELDAGAAAQDLQPSAGPFRSVGVHWLRGLLRLRRGDRTGARDEFDRELAFEQTAHLYARETCANTWYAIGALAIREGRPDAAERALNETLLRLPGHPLALAVLDASGGAAESSDAFAVRVERLTARSTVDAALARAVAAAARGNHERAGALMLETLTASPPGSGGWVLPVEPMLDTDSHNRFWSGALAVLRNRAV